MIDVMFVCHGNICRSPMAEFVMKKLVRKSGLEKKINVQSAATSTDALGSDIHIGTIEKLREKGVEFSKRRAVQITDEDYDKFNYIAVMDRDNLYNIKRIIKADSENKIRLLMSYAGENRDIADPWYTGNFDETYEDVLKGCTALLKEIKKSL